VGITKDGAVRVPAWQRETPAEHRFPAALALFAAIVLQLSLPSSLVLKPWWLLPSVELVLLISLMAVNPRRVRQSRALRVTGLSMCAIVSLANGVSCALLVKALTTGVPAMPGKDLLTAGAAVWLTNVIVFSLWYWELDRGGPAERAAGTYAHTDFLFVQMTSPHTAQPEWEPTFFDYLFTAFTNATSFSPTDTMPLTLWAKATMMLQEMISIVTLALVVARAVSTLG
jgi:hypothetical protein